MDGRSLSKLDKTFRAIAREMFLPSTEELLSKMDIPLPIGFGQTNSQPTTVKKMMEWLDVKPGMKILDVGSGSGWTTALLCNLSGPKGVVYAVEIVPKLLEFGKRNVLKAGMRNAEFFLAETEFGLSKHAPYERILVSAFSHETPKELLGQLVIGGKMVIPIGNDILEITKTTARKYDTVVHSGFVFVPLIKPKGIA